MFGRMLRGECVLPEVAVVPKERALMGGLANKSTIPQDQASSAQVDASTAPATISAIPSKRLKTGAISAKPSDVLRRKEAIIGVIAILL